MNNLDNLTELSNDLGYYEWLQERRFETLDIFKKFINWLSSEFDVYLQDASDGLVVYFPNGYFFISENGNHSEYIKFRIMVRSKCLNKGNAINSKIDMLLNHLKKCYKL